MKRYYSVITLLILSFLTFSCFEETPQFLAFDAYTFSSLDPEGGSWETLIVEDQETIQIDPPAPVTSASFQKELEVLTAKTLHVTRSEREAITYWTNNPVIRWNEIALEMAAKYNLIPGPNPDGSYTLPSPTQPEGPPAFPFAHPPYTSRMLAYLSAAQYDGLVLAWKFKFMYKRMAPSTYNASIRPAYPENELPAYPSHGAVVAKISKEILSLMFPLEAENLERHLQEHLSSLENAGLHVKSDIEAGILIADQVVHLAKKRAASDGMAAAQAPKSVSDSIAQSAFERFGWKWENTETPKRPVGLTPLFGRVRMWHVPNVEEVRSPMPPAIGSPAFQADVRELEHFARHLTLEQRRIANWWEDGLGSYTPPGHWNKFAKNSIVRQQLNPLRAARVFAYMNTAIMDAGIACWDTKYYYHYPRPVETIRSFRTILGTPNFPAYTSGHSTFSAAAAEVLAYFFPDEAENFRQWAEEAAISRIYGGIHYRFDATAGTIQGQKVGRYAIQKARLHEVAR